MALSYSCFHNSVKVMKVVTPYGPCQRDTSSVSVVLLVFVPTTKLCMKVPSIMCFFGTVLGSTLGDSSRAMNGE